MVRDYGRKPYITGSNTRKGKLRGGGQAGSYRQQMKRVPDSQANRDERHSEFKKPQNADDYSSMEHFRDPRQGGYNGPPTSGVAEGNMPYSPHIHWCFVHCYNVRSELQKPKCQIKVFIKDEMLWKSSHGLAKKEVGTTFSGLSKVIGYSDLYFNVNIGDTFEFEQWTDKCSRRIKHCRVKIAKIIKCSDCKDSFNQLAYDYDNSDSTVVREATADIVVSGGAAPYSWVESGTDFSLGSATTSDGTNTISAGASACGSATITVTDNCGKEVTGYIRCTTGVWILDDEAGVNADNQDRGGTIAGVCTGADWVQGDWDAFEDGAYYTKYIGKYKMQEWVANNVSAGGQNWCVGAEMRYPTIDALRFDCAGSGRCETWLPDGCVPCIATDNDCDDLDFDGTGYVQQGANGVFPCCLDNDAPEPNGAACRAVRYIRRYEWGCA